MQGGGFRTAFTSGVLDAFLVAERMEFEGYVAVSGGSIALSYFLAKQYGHCFEAMKLLADDPNFVQVKRLMSEEGYMDIDYLERISREVMPLDLEAAVKASVNKLLRMVVSSRDTGKAEYLEPQKEDWIKTVIASCTLPFVTKGTYNLRDKKYFDGGWADSIPSRWAYKKGFKKQLIILTSPLDHKLKQSWPDYLGSIYFRANQPLSRCFALSHEVYNDALTFISSPPLDAEFKVIAPEQLLLSGSYSYSGDSLLQDYRHGLDLGMRFLMQNREYNIIST